MSAPLRLLAAIPDTLLRHRPNDAKQDRARAAALGKHCVEVLGFRPFLVDLHEERLRRGLARVALDDLPRHYAEQDAQARAARLARVMRSR